MRIFTNEASTVNALARADDRVEAVAWDDFLSFGRLSSSMDPAEYARARAEVYASLGWDEDNVVAADLALRNRELEEALACGEDIHLLFGGSLRDQLQLAQILFLLSSSSDQALKQVSVMVIDGPLSVFDDGALLEVAKEGELLDFPLLDVYRSAWMAVTAPDVSHVEFAYRRLSGGPYASLAAALERWLQELPSSENGLSITQIQILDTVRLGVGFPQEVFEAVQETEAVPFRVNWEFWQELNLLCSGEDPLMQTTTGTNFICPPRDLAWIPFHDQKFELTERGLAVLEGRIHLSSGSFQARWLGGARIDGGSRWFWDYGQKAIVTEMKAAGVSV